MRAFEQQLKKNALVDFGSKTINRAELLSHIMT